MLLWHVLSRSRTSRSANVARPASQPSWQQWRKDVHQRQRGYAFTLGVRQQDETVQRPDANAHEYSDFDANSAYLDFILARQCAPPSTEPSRAQSPASSKKPVISNTATWPTTTEMSEPVLASSILAEDVEHSLIRRVEPSPRTHTQLRRRLANHSKAVPVPHVGKVFRPLRNPVERQRAALARKMPHLSPAEIMRLSTRLRANQEGLGTPARWTSSRSDLQPTAVFSSQWNVAFARLSRQYDLMRLPDNRRVDNIGEPQKNPETQQCLEEVLHMLHDESSNAIDLSNIAKRYHRLDRQVWADVALHLLKYDKPKVTRFIRATNHQPYPPINWVADCLQLIALHCQWAAGQTDEARSATFRDLIATFFEVLNRETLERWTFSDSSYIRLLLPFCTTEQVRKIFETIRSGRLQCSWLTVLQLVYRFAHADQMELALDALLQCEKTTGVEVNSVLFRSACSTILRQASRHPDGLRISLRIIENLSQLGLHLNVQLFNIVLLNSVEAGDLETAHKLYRSMIEQGHQPDKHTCAIRLKACKSDIDNAKLLKEVIQYTIEHVDVKNEDVVTGEILHCLALHHVKHNPKTAFETVATAFAQFYDTKPLNRLGLNMPGSPITDSDEPTAPKRAPTSFAIKHLIWTWLATQARVKDAAEIYDRWRELVKSGDPVLAPLAADSDVALANMFLYAFTKTKRSLLNAAQVVKDMQQPLPASASVTQAPPTRITWSTFLHGFVRQGEMKLAEQVLQYMRKRGMEPDVVTWTSLLGGYAQAQDAEGLAETVRRADEQGTVWNQWAEVSLRRFRNREKLKSILDEQRLQQSLDFSGELKEGLGVRLSKAGEREGVRGLRESARRPFGGERHADASAELEKLASSSSVST
ncbi:hypothetical protein BAUCODRAFT_33443 [Baudoinia panamericana UAMH 10762]|uniref:Pentacotripeptide-repeat region of PRORP domain-containing protein n=1 Tax=Baudoinia panamericana (strain UAMH 10762) TaxID=717646 RepID=M2MM16_BAUPA|nr:uncharacterized protein BAUCODRAFT_33443 [Baudoinia panamericana UAMH 10762]EMC97721.1 hypothetical protein BAUCODRAFT_33443 [Baudoinia panamericana UAMH 10762]